MIERIRKMGVETLVGTFDPSGKCVFKRRYSRFGGKGSQARLEATKLEGLGQRRCQ